MKFPSTIGIFRDWFICHVLSEDYAITSITKLSCSAEGVLTIVSKGSLSEDFLRCKFLNKIVYAFLYSICELMQKVIKHSQDTFEI